MSTAVATKIDYLYSLKEGEEAQYLDRYPVLRITTKTLWVHERVYDSMTSPTYYNKYRVPVDWEPCRPDSLPSSGYWKIRIEAIETRGEFYHRPSRNLFNKDVPDYWHRVIANFTQKKKPLPECFRLFGFSSMPTSAQFEAAYKALAVRLHPDMGGDKDAFAIAAYQAEECRKRLAEVAA